jgi:hypothetical protein
VKFRRADHKTFINEAAYRHADSSARLHNEILVRDKIKIMLEKCNNGYILINYGTP